MRDISKIYSAEPSICRGRKSRQTKRLKQNIRGNDSNGYLAGGHDETAAGYVALLREGPQRVAVRVALEAAADVAVATQLLEQRWPLSVRAAKLGYPVILRFRPFEFRPHLSFSVARRNATQQFFWQFPAGSGNTRRRKACHFRAGRLEGR